MHPQWFNYLYHYGVGGFFFLLAMVTMFRTGALRWDRGPDRMLVRGLVFGLASFMVVHGTWIWLVIHS